MLHLRSPKALVDGGAHGPNSFGAGGVQSLGTERMKLFVMGASSLRSADCLV